MRRNLGGSGRGAPLDTRCGDAGSGGYLLEPVQALSNEEIKSIPLGNPILSIRTGRYPDNLLLWERSSGRIDVVIGGLRRWIPDVGTFSYRGYCWENVLDASVADWQDLPEGVPLPRVPQIAFVSERDGNSEIEVMNGDGLARLRLTHHSAHDFAPSWKPNSTRLVFVSTRDGDPQIYSMNSDGKALLRLTNEGGEKQRPSYSPDGTQIAFISNRSGRPQLWVMAEDGTQLRQLVDVEGDVKAYDWTRDGTRIVFEVEEAESRRAVWVVEADGSNVRRLTDADHSVWNVALSTKDQVVYASDQDGGVDLYLMDLDGGSEKRLTNNGLRNQLPAWSLSGELLAWVATDAHGTAALYIMNRDGTQQTELVRQIDIGEPPAWAPDNEVLAFVSKEGENWALYTIRPDGTRLKRLADDPSLVYGLAWSR